ncbi:putative TrmH family tRNA/rRNA methyltransferase [Clostridium acetireducens DSM 10703]|uniref:Putative TrmH family tRNA/rRNA methyltransferase n=1 Tax=Clostridium acetireducens DSM 10703 TaxID=1121290 RepID=A0A1E8EYT7_9CLOT|nr:RNA methyltransferase [Clostridium acetireducens]OFI06143.1 putative TrmH family tRNA/rRNA methyltransferase [Clostridium acetireducens DSM 10703]
MNKITSKENAIIKETKKLRDNKKYRMKNKQFIIEGFRFVEEALKSNFHVSTIFISDSAYEKEKIHSFLNIKNNVKLYVVKDFILKYICSTDNPQGIAAIVDYNNIKIKNEKGFYILVDKIQDPGNMGTIIRTAHASGALGVIYTKGTVDVYNEKTLRSTMGSIFYVPIIEDEDLSITKSLKNQGFKLIGSSLESEKNFYNLSLKDKIIISVGNEGNGLSKEVYDLCDILCKIPMPGNAESLNAAIASAIMMFEIVRQNSVNINK